MVDLIRKSVSTGELKVSTQLKSKLCVVGCGVALKNFEGIIERYSSMPQNCQLDDFDVYADGTLNAIIYEAIKSYLFDLNMFSEYTKKDVLETFRFSYDAAYKITTRVNDLWDVICETISVVSSENEEEDLQKEIVEGNIIWGILIFLLSNVEYPNYKRFKKDLIRLEKELTEQPDSFLYYLWEAFLEYVAESIEVHQNKATEKTKGDVDETIGNESLFLFMKKTDMLIWRERLKEFYGDKINILLDSSEQNPILRCLVCFLEVWQKRGLLINRPNRDAIRFLEICGFKRDGVGVEKIADVLGRLRRKSDKLCEERELVRTYMENT